MPAHAQDLQAGKRKAVGCQTSHGMDGLSKMPDAPNIAGQPAAYYTAIEIEVKAVP